MATKRDFGSVRRLTSGRWQARYLGPDGRSRPAPDTFATKAEASRWLATMQTDIERRIWRAPESEDVPLRDYAASWLETRDLRPRTLADYKACLAHHVLPHLGDVPLGRISPATVRQWHHRLGGQTGPTMRAHAYALLRTILATAVSEDALATNPCRIRGAGSVKRAKHIVPATLPELTTLTQRMPERLRPMILLAAWCAMRQGELFELRRSDVDLDVGVVRVRRGVVRAEGQVIVGGPKTEAGSRNIAIPPHLVAVLQAHLDDHVGPRPDALLFPARHGGHLAPSTLYKTFYPAREAAGRPDLRFHDLRHTGAVLAAATGATIAELMARVGHSTPAAAMRYQHAAEDRDQAIAAALSEFAAGTVVPLRGRRKSG